MCPVPKQDGAFSLREQRSKTFRAIPKIVKQTDDLEAVQGVITARFATFDVLDHDFDIIRPGSVQAQRVNAGLYNHVMASPTPAGYGDTYEEEGAAYATNTYLLDTFAGRETYTYLKAMADVGRDVEWSFVFYIEDGNDLNDEDPLYEERDGFFGLQAPYEIKDMDIISVDPVGRGAGIDTATVDAKHCGPACEAARGGTVSAETVSQISGEKDQIVPEKSDNAPRIEINYEKLADAIVAAMAKAKVSIDTEEEEDCGCDDKESDTETQQVKGEQLGDLIRELRDERDLTNEDLAEAAGVSVAMIGQMMAGTIDCPPIGRLQSLARRLRVNPSRLVSAAERDGCDRYEDEDEAARDEDTASKDDEDVDNQSNSDSLQRQIDSIMADFPGLPKDIDPAVLAWEDYEMEALIRQE